MAELLDGSPGHRALSSVELTGWMELEQIRVWEAEQAQKKRR